MNAEETARGRSDSAPQAEQAEEIHATSADGTEETVVEEVTDEKVTQHWRKPHPRIATGPLTGDRP